MERGTRKAGSTKKVAVGMTSTTPDAMACDVPPYHDIEWQLRYGSEEQPEVAGFLGYKEKTMKVGDLVLALDRPGIWREAYLIRHEPYSVRGQFITDGFRIHWKEIPPPPPYDPYYRASEGGWKSINMLKEVS